MGNKSKKYTRNECKTSLFSSRNECVYDNRWSGLIDSCFCPGRAVGAFSQDIFSSKNTLETGGEDRNLHSKRVEKIWMYTRNGCRRLELNVLPALCRICSISFLVASRIWAVWRSEKDTVHSKRVCFLQNYTRNECAFCKTTLETSIFYRRRGQRLSRFWPVSWKKRGSLAFHLYTRFECIFTSSPLVSSVFPPVVNGFQ